MSRHHDPEAAECRCFHCTEARWREQSAAEAQADRAFRARSARAAMLDRDQLRLPIFPLPHAAHLPRSL